MKHAEKPRCGECGMELRSYAEYHPYEACVAFEETQSSSEVRKILRRMLVAVPLPEDAQ